MSEKSFISQIPTNNLPTEQQSNKAGNEQNTSKLAKTGRKIPPLEKWQPEHTGDMDLIIKANGEWWHEGTKMTKQKLVDLFASILWCEKNNHTGKNHYFLKTPVEKVSIQVEDAPLMVNSVTQFTEDNTQWLQFTTQTGDVINASSSNPIYMQTYENDMRPYIRVRHNLHALIHRNTFYHLIEMGELIEETHHHKTATFLILKSGDAVFKLAAL